MATATPIPERLKKLKRLTVYSGNHPEPDNGEPVGCANELISWVCGLPWSESPPCTDERLSRLIVAINDGIPDEKKRSRYMRKVIPLAINTADRKDEITDLLNRLAIARLKEECLPLAKTWPKAIRAEVVAAVEQVIAALGGEGDLSAESAARSAAESAARSAAESAVSAARSAAESAVSAVSAAESAVSAVSAAESAWSAVSAAESAWSAVSAARSAAWSAESAARSAAFEREADRLITELKDLDDDH